MTQLTILLPAAGASRRMRGRDKLVEEIGGQPLLRRQVIVALGTGTPVLVTLPAEDGARARALAGLDCTRVTVGDPAEGMAASLRAGHAAADAGHALMVLLPDMPDLTTDDLARMIARFSTHPDTVLRATSEDGVDGHPVILPARQRARIPALRGDTGARSLIANEKVARLALPGNRATTDLDTPEAWARWRARQAG
ncbi:nucleotidyltransferase family protein [Roseovarius sp. SCSIO 43702]|uniref:nucleotidyltransferase family protein n=1 Tax=Roseovarius sp. SCSIO 43702 TaxID=2823043 RepID=UPI001C7381B7|nr:nucleotidyltransferase family protein [Roseovarius sp. SCSIO 43702]QYX58332.1 nucleotidyltransferase family protein [Roseovarius sp. SCSIO 43702]